jgi:co-chaperonin GroES (HSP10)
MKGRHMALTEAKEFIVEDRRGISGYRKPEAPEIHGVVAAFVPFGDYVLVKRLKEVVESGGIVRPEVAIELSERGIVVATSRKASEDIQAGVIAKFSKFGAEEIHFDNEGQDRYALVRTMDIRGYHLARD